MKESRHSRVSTRAAAIACAAAVALGASSAHADPTCISAYEQTQTLRKDGKLLASRAQAAICAKASCNALLAKDCARWLAELDAVIPTVILDPRTPAGQPRADVHVQLDGASLDEPLDGKPLPLEPGSHSFVFEAEGAAPVERTVVLKEGAASVKVTVTLAPATVPTKMASARPTPLGVWIFGGVSAVALVTSAVFASDGLAKKGDLDQCKPRCASADVDAMSSSFTFADVALGAGVMAGAAAVYLFLTRPDVASKGSRSAEATPFAAPLPGGGAVGLRARF